MGCNLTASCDENGNWTGDGACFLGSCDCGYTCPDTDPKCNSVEFKYKCGKIIYYAAISYAGSCCDDGGQLSDLCKCPGESQYGLWPPIPPAPPETVQCYTCFGPGAVSGPVSIFNFECSNSIEDLVDKINESCCCEQAPTTDSGSGGPESCSSSGWTVVNVEFAENALCGESGSYFCDNTIPCEKTCSDITVKVETDFTCGLAKGQSGPHLVSVDGCCCGPISLRNQLFTVTASLQGGEDCGVVILSNNGWSSTGTSATIQLSPGSGIPTPQIDSEIIEAPVDCPCVVFNNIFDTYDPNFPSLSAKKCSCYAVQENGGCDGVPNGTYNGLQDTTCGTGAALFIKKIFGNKIKIKINKKELLHRLKTSSKFKIDKRKRRNDRFKDF